MTDAFCRRCGATDPGQISCWACATAVTGPHANPRAAVSCPRCDRTMDRDTSACPDCGLVLVRDDREQLPCRGCGGTATRVQLCGRGSDVWVWRCDACGRDWVPNTSWAAIRSTFTPPERSFRANAVARRSLDVLNTEVVYLRCPECNEPMIRWNLDHFSGVLVDRCSLHGVLMDTGHLPHAIAYVRTGGTLLSERLRR